MPGRRALTVALAAAAAALTVPAAAGAACERDLRAAWPVPVPTWYWDWAEWHLGRGDYEGRARERQARPGEAPQRVPRWAWRRLHAQLGDPRPPELPRGGRDLLPDNRVVALYGAPQVEALGALGIGTPAQAARRLRGQAAPYRRLGNRPVIPAFELIAVVVQASPGGDGKYRFRQPDRVVCRYLRAARQAGALLLLDIQPGRSTFMAEVRRLERYLREPDVGLALDPEWRMHGSAVPGRTIGHTTAGAVNRVSAFLARLVEEDDLPEKLLVVHQFTPQMIRNKGKLVEREGVALVLNADGFGTTSQKVSKYDLLTGRRDRFFHGFKLFYEEDTGLMSPRRVLALRPTPDFVVYE